MLSHSIHHTPMTRSVFNIIVVYVVFFFSSEICDFYRFQYLCICAVMDDVQECCTSDFQLQIVHKNNWFLMSCSIHLVNSEMENAKYATYKATNSAMSSWGYLCNAENISSTLNWILMVFVWCVCSCQSFLNNQPNSMWAIDKPKIIQSNICLELDGGVCRLRSKSFVYEFDRLFRGIWLFSNLKSGTKNKVNYMHAIRTYANEFD